MPHSLAFVRKSLALAIGALSLCATTAQAGPSPFQDARSFAMGGVGVASASPISASFLNPAMLAMQSDERHDSFAAIFPSLNARIANDDELIDQIDDYTNNDFYDRFTQAVDAFNNTRNDATFNAVISSAESMQRELSALNGDAIRGDVGLGTAFAVPNQTIALGAFVSASARVTGIVNYRDNDKLNEYITTATDIYTNNLPDQLPEDFNTQLQSDGQVVGAAITQGGVSIAHALELNGNTLAVGVSPKILEIQTFDYLARAESFDDGEFDSDDNESSKTQFNLDVGAAYQMASLPGVTFGASIINMIPIEVETKRGNKIEIDPKVRVGIAHSTDLYTLAADLDLTKTEAFGFEQDTQFLSIGGEVDLMDMFQIRAGLRQNLASDDGAAESIKEGTQFTAGIGLSPFGMVFDLSGMISDKEYGAALQIGALF